MSGVMICRVESIADENCAGRIMVRIPVEDDSKKEKLNKKKYPDKLSDKCEYAFPLLPKHLHIMPKVGELVFVLTESDSNSRRYYIGPIISQAQNLYYDDAENAQQVLEGGILAPEKAVSCRNIDDDDVNHVVYPKTDQVSIEGRKNCGIQINDDELMIKAGVKSISSTKENDVSFNANSNASYMLMKYDSDNSKKDLDGKTYNSTATIVSDRINLLGNVPSIAGSTIPNLYDKEKLITDDDMTTIINELYKVPLGEKLVEFLNLFRKAFLEHTHPMSMLPPVLLNTNAEKLSNYDTATILSNNIRIN